MLYTRDPILPIDSILSVREPYRGEDTYILTLEKMHESFMLVHKNIKASKKGSAKYHDSNAQNVNLKVGDPVFLKQNIRKSKLDRKWVPFWRIVEQKSPLIYVVMNQLDGTIRETHARHIRLANVDEWHPTKKDFERQKKGKTNYLA